MSYLRKAIVAIVTTLVVVTVFSWYAIAELDYSVLEKRSRVVYDAQHNVLGYSLSSDDDSYRFYTTSADVDPLYIDMLIASEDRRFRTHCGVDFVALFRAFVGNIKNGGISSGGSTLAMQVVKKLTGHERTYINKLKEIVQAIYITNKFGREQVLNWYLTLAPFGSNIEGVKAASLRWFGHLPNHMTPSEAAVLTALPRAPEKIRPDRNYKSAIYYKNEVLRLAYEMNVISKDVWETAILDELPQKLFAIPQSSKSMAQYLFSRHKEHEIYTSVDPYIQSLLLKAAQEFHKEHNDGAVVSALVLDNNIHAVTGILGTSDLKVTEMCLPFYGRSPGSSLKPFVYAQAFEERKLHPNTIVHDISQLYGRWSPENFSKTFTGKVRARKALTSSLNLPALEVVNLVGTDHFYRRINLDHQRLYVKNNNPDASLILGSGTITLYDLAELYAMLNEDGKINHYTLIEGEETRPFVTMFEPDSARVTFDILKETTRPINGIGMDDVSYKTGTSSRFTDALAIGSLGNYTLAVAIRIPDNKTTNYHYSGYKDAAPILFEILRQLKTTNMEKPILNSELFNNNSPLALSELIDEKKIIDPYEIHIIFPKEGDVVIPDYRGNIFIKYTGGRGRIFLNAGEEQLEQTYFAPKGDGVYTISLMDEDGHSDSVSFIVETEKSQNEQ